MQVHTCKASIRHPRGECKYLHASPAKALAVTLDLPTLKALCREASFAPASVVVAAIDPPGGRVALDPYRPLYPASMIKVPLAAAVLALGLDLDAIHPVTPANMTANDAKSRLEPGYRAPLRELLERAIARSDNVATNMLFDLAGRERATALVREQLGLRETAFYRKLSGSEPLIEDLGWDGVHRNAHPAGDAARLFSAIADDAVPQAALLRRILAAQIWNDKLSTGLRDGDRFAHKTGDTGEVTHDGGILTTPESRRYAVVAYLGLPSSPEHNARFGALMRALREHL